MTKITISSNDKLTRFDEHPHEDLPAISINKDYMLLGEVGVIFPEISSKPMQTLWGVPIIEKQSDTPNEQGRILKTCPPKWARVIKEEVTLTEETIEKIRKLFDE